MLTDSISMFPDSLCFVPSHLGLEMRKRVLLVEDDPSTRWLVRNALKERCDLMTASTGERAVDMYGQCMPEVVFLDFNLPGKNGYDVLKMILDKDPGAFVVVMSGQENLEILLDLCQHGARGLVTKPYTRTDILYYLVNSPALR